MIQNLYYLIKVIYRPFARRVSRYQRCNQNPYTEEEQTTQWPKDTKEVIIIRIPKKNRQHNGQKYQRYNKGPQNTTQKLKIMLQHAIKELSELGCSASGIHRGTRVTNPVISRNRLSVMNVERASL